MAEQHPTGGRHRLRTTETDPAEEPMSADTAEATKYLEHPWPTEADNRRAEQAGGAS